MSESKLIDRYEPLESILSLYKRWGQSSTLIKHICRFIGQNLRIKKEDRRYLFDCMFKQQQQRDRKIKNFLVIEAHDISLEEQLNLIELLIIQTKAQINKIQDQDQRLELFAILNDRIYKQMNIISAFRQNARDFINLFELWKNHMLTA